MYMKDHNDSVMHIEACGKRRLRFMFYCDICNGKMGYRRDKEMKLKVVHRCLVCSNKQREHITEQFKSDHPHVNFDDYITHDHACKTVRGLPVRNRKYKTTCRFCGGDKGYTRKKHIDLRCRKCVMTPERRAITSCHTRSAKIEIEQYSGHITPLNTLIRQSELGKLWKKQVLYRANYKCQLCASKELLCCHHLNSFDTHAEQRFDVDNGVCLCRNCHAAFHKQHGKGKNTIEQFEQFKLSLALRMSE